jgi:hypothetical protein
MGEVIEGAMQQAPHPERQSMTQTFIEKDETPEYYALKRPFENERSMTCTGSIA